MDIIIGASDAGTTVLCYLTKRLNLSHRAISRLKRLENGITLDGRRVTVRALLCEGSLLSLMCEDLPEEVNPYIEPVFHELSILYEDEDIVIPNKPGKMPTHISRGHTRDTLANALAYYYRDVPFVFRSVNRLDRDTSGVCIIAKNRKSAGALSEQLALGLICKKYIAVLSGRILPECGTIEGYIRRTQNSIITRCVCEKDEEGAKYAKTEYRLIGYENNMSIVECEPKTGRTHQLRVHFASVGHPIVGDSLYSIPSPQISRQALHAFSISFIRPSSGEKMTVSAPVPDDILSLLGRKELHP